MSYLVVLANILSLISYVYCVNSTHDYWKFFRYSDSLIFMEYVQLGDLVQSIDALDSQYGGSGSWGFPQPDFEPDDFSIHEYPPKGFVLYIPSGTSKSEFLYHLKPGHRVVNGDWLLSSRWNQKVSGSDYPDNFRDELLKYVYLGYVVLTSEVTLFERYDTTFKGACGVVDVPTSSSVVPFGIVFEPKSEKAVQRVDQVTRAAKQLCSGHVYRSIAHALRELALELRA